MSDKKSSNPFDNFSGATAKHDPAARGGRDGEKTIIQGGNTVDGLADNGSTDGDIAALLGATAGQDVVNEKIEDDKKEEEEKEEVDLSNTTLEIEEDETIEVPEITPPPSSAPVAAPAATPAQPVFDASAVADAIMSKREHHDALTKRVAEILRLGDEEKAATERRRRQTTVDKDATQQTAPASPPEEKSSWAWLGWTVLCLAFCTFCVWGTYVLFDGKNSRGATTVEDAGVEQEEASWLVDPINPTPPPPPPPPPTAPRLSVTITPQSSCISQLVLERAPWDQAERIRRNCGHDVNCPVAGIDYSQRTFVDDGVTYLDLRPRPNADIAAERAGCTLE